MEFGREARNLSGFVSAKTRRILKFLGLLALGSFAQSALAQTPDLVAESFAISKTELFTGELYSVSGVARNQGDAFNNAVQMIFYQSDDMSYDSSDVGVSMQPVTGLSPGASISRMSGLLTGPSEPGTYYYGACVQIPTNGDSNPANNCTNFVPLEVKSRTPDLTPIKVFALDSGQMVTEKSVLTGDEFTIFASVTNIGNENSEQTVLRYFRSNDSLISATDTEVGSSSIFGMFPGNEAAVSNSVSFPRAGTFWVGVCVDMVENETVLDNQCSISIRINVTDPLVPDLAASAIDVSDTTPVLNSTFNVDATIDNLGASGSSASTIRFFTSSDSTITSNDNLLISISIPALASGAKVSRAITLNADELISTYLGFCVESVAGELNVANQCSDGVLIEVVEPKIDLVVEKLISTDLKPELGKTIMVTATIKNQGDLRLNDDSRLRFYASVDSKIDGSDTLLATRTLTQSVEPGQRVTAATTITAGSAGPVYIGACIDSVANEFPSNNQCNAILIDFGNTAGLAASRLPSIYMLLLQLEN